jgi:hypothetical protein
VIALWGYSFF